MPNPIIGVFSDIPQSSETSAGSSAAQNTQRYKEIEQIAKYNRDNNTNFYTLAQIQEHQRKLQELERAKAAASNPDPEDVRDAYISALNPQTTEDVDKIRKWDKDAATTTAIGLAAVGTIPEMATFGIVPGLARYGLGLVTGHYGSQAGTTAGNWLDNKLNTNVFSPTLGFVGGLAGYGMGADMVTGIGRIPLWKTYKPLSTNAPQLTGHFGQVKYYGPTMGKTTAAKSNPKLVDFDDIIRQPSRNILDRFGFKNKAEMYNSGNQEAIKAYEDMLVKSLRDWRANPENSNLTLVASPTAIANPTKTGFYFDNMPSIPSRSVFITRNVGRGGTPEASAMWYDSLMKENPNLKIDNRFVSEIEKQAYITPNTGYKSIFMEEPIMGSSKGLTEAEKLGIPKSLRSDPRALEDPYYWGYEQWNQRYDDALNKGDYQEVQRIRDLHFKTKAPDTKVIDENGMPLHMYHGTGIDVYNNYKPKRFTRYEGVNWDLEDAVDSGIKGNHWKLSIPNDYRMTSYHTPNKNIAKNYFGVLHDDYLNIKNPIKWDESNLKKITGRDYISDWADFIAGKKELMQQGYDGLYIPQYYDSYGAFVSPSQFKSADPITWNGKGEIVPIVKRDNFHNLDRRYKQGGKIKPVLKAQSGNVIGVSPIPNLIPKKLFELVAKRSNAAQTKSIPIIIGDVLTGRDKSFYNENNINGSNEIDTYLYGKPYNSIFTGDASVGPDYTNYINKNYPGREIKTYNTHFGDTLYIDNKAKSLVEKQLNNGEVVGGSMGRYAHAPSYIVTKEEGRPYDAGGHLMKFGRDKDGNIVANMSDIYDFLPEDFNDKYNQTENPSWTRTLANNIGTPFIVRQNNIPVRFKEIVPEYKTDKQRRLGDFLSQWGDMYDLKLPLRLTDSQIDEIFDGRDYGDDILDFMISKGYINPVYKSGGVIKGQDGIPEIDGGELNPAVVKPKPVKIILQTDPITKNTPITHSSLKVPTVSKEDLGFFISKGSDDATYNLFTANCSDATGKCLQDITGVDFTSGITTPIGVSRKVRSVFGNQSGYTESGGGLFKPRIQSFEVPWYDYRKAKDLYNERFLNSLIKRWRTDGGVWSEERENKIIKNWWEQHPKLKYYLDENNNVIKNPQQ